jgi:hypothetical protein
VGVTDVGGAAGADAIGGGGDNIGRDPVVITTAICSGTTCRPVCGDPRRGSDGGAIGLGEERLGDPRRGGDGGAIGFDWAGGSPDGDFMRRALSEVGYRAQWGLLVGPGRAGGGGGKLGLGGWGLCIGELKCTQVRTKMQQGATAIANAQTLLVSFTPPMRPARSMQGGNLFCLGSKKCNIS